MKKIISLLLALVMVMGLSVTAFADGNATQTTTPTTSDAAITASYEAPDAQYVHTYKATVAWEQTGTIKYTAATTVYTWNTDKLEYESTSNTENNKWTIDKAQVKITVTNYSDQAITANLNTPKPNSSAGVTGIGGFYYSDKRELKLASAYVENGTSEATSDYTTFSISTVEGSITQQGATIATVTVKLSIDDNG